MRPAAAAAHALGVRIDQGSVVFNPRRRITRKTGASNWRPFVFRRTGGQEWWVPLIAAM